MRQLQWSLGVKGLNSQIFVNIPSELTSSSHTFVVRNIALFVISCGVWGCHLKTLPMVDNNDAKMKYVTIISEILII